MNALRGLVLLLLAAWACAGSLAAQAQTLVPGSPWHAVLVAGSDDLRVFDRATAAIRQRLIADGTAPADIQKLTALPSVAARDGSAPAQLDQVVAAISQMRPSPGQGCFVFITSHGAPGQGLYLAPQDEFLTPAALDQALVLGCGDAPTVVIASGCFSGGFARPPMTRPNRIVLTAARPDRPSFGCGAGFDYTVYDRCLLRAIGRSSDWREIDGMTRACVTAAERAWHFAASGPQAWFGTSVSAGLGLRKTP